MRRMATSSILRLRRSATRSKYDLARAENDAAHVRAVDELIGLGEDAAERAVRPEIGERRDAILVTQQRLRRHHHQRLAEGAAHLATQRMVIVGWRRRIDDLPVVLGGELQVALETRGAVLRSLALVAVRQQQHETRHAQPLALARADELVDDDLRAVGEVAELRFPQDERIGLGQRVAVLEAQHTRLVQRAVDHLEMGLAVRDIVERDVLGLTHLIDQHRMALGEGAAT